jgi:dethiobiotin synthetase
VGNGIFVTGTDTGVGKTVVAVGIAVALREKGFDVGVMKPVESGCVRENGRLIPEDAVLLRDTAGCNDELEMINPYALEHPLAPAIAAELEGVEISLSTIKQAYETLASRHQLIIVEGAGGALVPLTGEHSMADMAKELGVPMLIVCGANLGVINQTLLTEYYAEHEGISVVGVIMKNVSETSGLAEMTNPDAVKRRLRVPFLGTIPYLGSLTAEVLGSAIEANVDLGPVTALIAGR